ncbi:putative N-acetylmannosamine-6-phosphate 2-epimerase [Micromonospora rifamycinica]|uniref:N-acetylmannosamine-6-phosphate 2-epimerase n=1 Tax=Micromonospora rifamycinica TaxID=291594 RepID=UPI00343BAF22
MNVADALRGRLIVSCQAQGRSPFRDTGHMMAMAAAAVLGGAAGLRGQGVDHVRGMVDLGVPVVGLVKRRTPGSPVYITPSEADVTALIGAGAQIVAADATGRPRAGGEKLPDLVAATHASGALFMADVDSLDAAMAAVDAGADLVGTTLSGYTVGPVPDGPDIALVGQLSRHCPVPVIAEGRYRTRTQVSAAFDEGAWAVVVGTAISDPVNTTRRFAQACPHPRLDS